MGCTGSGCEAMYSSTDWKPVLAIVSNGFSRPDYRSVSEDARLEKSAPPRPAIH
jgi:hypothetical protein